MAMITDRLFVDLKKWLGYTSVPQETKDGKSIIGFGRSLGPFDGLTVLESEVLLKNDILMYSKVLDEYLDSLGIKIKGRRYFALLNLLICGITIEDMRYNDDFNNAMRENDWGGVIDCVSGFKLHDISGVRPTRKEQIIEDLRNG